MSHHRPSATSGAASAMGSTLRSAAAVARPRRTASGCATCTTRSGVAAANRRQSSPAMRTWL